ncbi:hypothetical protein AB1Y20_005783 [Prymnesium parvum]|uniref:EGF-like domain-containing protein n=1 Tax=Prymnesium parvum TaxID=97485 RepID=A0AB34J0R3_PRYPA
MWLLVGNGCCRPLGTWEYWEGYSYAQCQSKCEQLPACDAFALRRQYDFLTTGMCVAYTLDFDNGPLGVNEDCSGYLSNYITECFSLYPYPAPPSPPLPPRSTSVRGQASSSAFGNSSQQAAATVSQLAGSISSGAAGGWVATGGGGLVYNSSGANGSIAAAVRTGPLDAGTIQLGGQAVSLSSKNKGNGTVLAVVVPPSSTGTSSDATMVTDIVAVTLLNRSSDGEDDASVNVSFSLSQPPGNGNGTCAPPRLLMPFDASQSCVAGCCIDGRCVCKPGYGGPRCEVELSCFSSSGGAAFSSEGCQTIYDGGDGVLCACSSFGLYAVLQYRISPVLDFDLRRTNFVGFVRQLITPGWVCVLVTYFSAMALAFYFDQRTLYMAKPPRWLQTKPGRVTYSVFVRNLRTRTTLLRSCFVVREYTLYSRVQLTHSFALNLSMTTLTVALFFGSQSCSADGYWLLGVICGLVCSISALLCRLSFKFAAFGDDPRYKTAYSAHKHEHLFRIRNAFISDDMNDSFSCGEAPPPPSDAPASSPGGGQLIKLLPASPPLSPPSPQPPSPPSSPAAPPSPRSRVWNLRRAVAPSPSAIYSSPDLPAPAASTEALPREPLWHKEGKGTSRPAPSRQRKPAAPPQPAVPSRRSSLMGACYGVKRRLHGQATGGQGESLGAAEGGALRRWRRCKVMAKIASSRRVSSDEGCVVVLKPQQLAVGDDGYTIGTLVPDQGGNACKFIPAEQVSALSTWNPFTSSLRVQFPRDRKELLTASAKSIKPAGSAPIKRFQRGWRIILAWTLNLSVILVVVVGLVFLSARSRKISTEDLQQTGQDEGTWWRAVTGGVLLACAESYLLMDAIKILLFTLTSSTILDRALPPGSSARNAVHKPLRRLHMIIDVVA